MSAPPLWDDPALIRSDDKARELAARLGDGRAIVMRGNGAISVGADIEQAACLAWLLEDAASVEMAVRSVNNDCAQAATTYSDDEVTARAIFTGALIERMWEYLTFGDPE
jgi:HCOMODA/2-hydroxy-3-carboxy-muconic semialdehyde decarboxylase